MAEGMIAENMGELSSDKVAEGIKMPPELQEAYERVVIAGMKVMFSKQTHQYFIDQLQAEGQMAQKLGQGVAGLMMFLFKESNQTIPPEVIIPAGIRLLTKAADFINQSGKAKVSNQEIGDAMELMITTLLTQFGVAPEQMEELFAQYSDQNIQDPAAQTPAQPAPAQPVQPAVPPQPGVAA